jgi:hypothetical protein
MSCSITIMTLACPIRPTYEAVFFEVIGYASIKLSNSA